MFEYWSYIGMDGRARALGGHWGAVFPFEAAALARAVADGLGAGPVCLYLQLCAYRSGDAARGVSMSSVPDMFI